MFTYKLVLNQSERRAIDWVGHRDWNGDDLKAILLQCEWAWYGDCPESDPDGIESDWRTSIYSFEYSIPEHLAWAIFELWHEGGQIIPHFAPELSLKIQTLLDSIV